MVPWVRIVVVQSSMILITINFTGQSLKDMMKYLGGQDNLNIKTGFYEIRRHQHCHLVVLLDWKINNKTKTAYNPATNYCKHCTYVFMFVYLYETVTRYHHH